MADPAPDPEATGTSSEEVISRTLMIGVILSLVVLLVGTIVSYFGHPAYLLSPAELDRLHSPGEALPQTIGDVVSGARHGHGPSIIALGLLILIGTPVARVAVSIVTFVRHRDRVYTAITSTVLILLLLSFLIGTTH